MHHRGIRRSQSKALSKVQHNPDMLGKSLPSRALLPPVYEVMSRAKRTGDPRRRGLEIGTSFSDVTEVAVAQSGMNVVPTSLSWLWWTFLDK